MQKFFNPRLREGGDFFFHKLSFNPRLREGGDSVKSSISKGITFSIHASAKEATRFRKASAYVRGFFNPRLREGGDMLHPITLNALL